MGPKIHASSRAWLLAAGAAVVSAGQPDELLWLPGFAFGAALGLIAWPGVGRFLAYVGLSGMLYLLAEAVTIGLAEAVPPVLASALVGAGGALGLGLPLPLLRWPGLPPSALAQVALLGGLLSVLFVPICLRGAWEKNRVALTVAFGLWQGPVAWFLVTRGWVVGDARASAEP